ncbi:MAG: Stk1 family PASTA domain-containing Ser/Thr kinase [Actinobacteria bacterium]|nr:Stk1 family PASTA domain-containing Ser/Thr kinase [Actinomycetota bacterium]
MPSPPPRGATAPGVLAGRYRIDRLIGRGGMAEVYLAHDDVLDRTVAVKLLSGRFRSDDQFLLRFRREAQQAASLNHPNIVVVFDTGEHNGMPFIVMEYLRGLSLQQVLDRGGVTEERALELCAEVCAGLAYAHERGLAHRDIKPGNIMVAFDGSVKVTDFGIARAIDTETVTQTASVLGTAAYLSPEQAQGSGVDARSDIYSLGVVLYELLTNRQPFLGDSAVGVAYQHVQENPIPPREIDPSISPAAEAIAIKAMAKNPSNRYSSARAMQDDLLRARAGQTVIAPAVLLPNETAQLDATAVSTRPPVTAVQERRKHVLGYALLAVFTILAFVFGAMFINSALGGNNAQMRQVPSVKGRTAVEAQDALEAAGLDYRLAAEAYSSDVAKGLVLDQDPEAGEMVEDGSEVELTLSKGPQPTTVPPVAGLGEEEAIAAIRDAGLTFGGRQTVFSDEVEEGQVVATEPEVGTSVPVGTAVTLHVSAGEETAIVPNVVGLLESDARFQLEEREFVVLVTREFSDSVDDGRVIRQDPEGNSTAPLGSEAIIVVSEGPSQPASPSPTPSDSTSPSESTSPSPTSSPSPSDGSTLPTPAQPGEGVGRGRRG